MNCINRYGWRNLMKNNLFSFSDDCRILNDNQVVSCHLFSVKYEINFIGSNKKSFIGKICCYSLITSALISLAFLKWLLIRQMDAWSFDRWNDDDDWNWKHLINLFQSVFFSYTFFSYHVKFSQSFKKSQSKNNFYFSDIFCFYNYFFFYRQAQLILIIMKVIQDPFAHLMKKFVVYFYLENWSIYLFSRVFFVQFVVVNLLIQPDLNIIIYKLIHNQNQQLLIKIPMVIKTR